jgi:hypothetical protein
MKRETLSLLVLAGALACPPAARTQQKVAGRAAERGAVSGARRQEALQTLQFLRNSAADIEQPRERIRVLLEVADAFWPAEEEQARELFRQAAGLAAEFDAAAAEGEKAGKAAGALLRQTVITRIARRDPSLAHKLLLEYAPTKPGRQAEGDAFGQLYGRDDAKNDLLLNAASELLQTDPATAGEVARFAAAGGFSQGLRSFLLALRAKSPAEADALYEVVFRQASAHRPRELSEALFIWDYAFRPGTIYLGPVAWLGERSSPPTPVTPEVKRRALAFAVEAIVDNVQQFDLSAAPEPEKPLVRERYVLIYSLASQIMPDVEKFLPASVPLLQTHLRRLAQALSEVGGKLPSPPEPLPSGAGTKDGVEKWLDIAPRVTNPQLRDGAYARAALTLYLRGEYERALEVAGKIEGAALARQLTEPVRFDQAGELIERGSLFEAEKVARAIESPAVRATLLARLGAAYFDAKKPAQAAAVLGEAEESAAKAGQPSASASAFLAVALSYAGHDQLRAAAVASAAVRAINAVEGEEPWELLQAGVGQKGRLSAQNPYWSSGKGGVVTSLAVTYPRLAGLFDVLSKLGEGDLGEGLMHARQVKSRGLSYAAQAMLCGRALERSGGVRQSTARGKSSS